MEEMSAQVESMSARAQQMAATAHQLHELVARFKLDSGSTIEAPKLLSVAPLGNQSVGNHGCVCARARGSQLTRDQMRVQLIERQKLAVRATLNHRTVVQNNDPVGMANGRQSVRDDQRRAPRAQPF